MIDVDLIIKAVLVLPYIYVVAWVSGRGFFAAKLAYHNEILKSTQTKDKL